MMTEGEGRITKATRLPVLQRGSPAQGDGARKVGEGREGNMESCSCVLPRADPSFRFPAKNPCPSSPTTAAFSRLQSKQIGGIVLPRSKSQTHRVWANASTSRGKRSSSDDVLMVDPLEAKRLAAIQMQEIQAKQRLKRQRQIEAINGAWAMIGLTAGLVIEGQTGQTILEQLAGYWTVIISLFNR